VHPAVLLLLLLLLLMLQQLLAPPPRVDRQGRGQQLRPAIGTCSRAYHAPRPRPPARPCPTRPPARSRPSPKTREEEELEALQAEMAL
jgi:hypothetical protein